MSDVIIDMFAMKITIYKSVNKAGIPQLIN